MKKSVYLLLSVLFLASCGGGQKNDRNTRQAKGDVYYGGVFRMNEVSDFRSLYPLNITETVGDRIASQVYEGLVKFSQEDLSILPCLAKKWEKNDNATVWTFYLRKGVRFQDDPCFPGGKGREVTAKDFKFCFDQLCTSSASNALFGMTFKDRVVGADKYFQSTVNKKPLPGGVSGVKVIDDYTLQITLKSPFAGFLNILATPGCWVFPHEALKKYGVDMNVHHCVGTGPFQAKTIKQGDAVILVRNKHYWDVDEYGNQLPYLDAIKVSFVKEKKSELMEFKRGNLDMMYQLPVEMIPDILGELDHAKQSNIDYKLQVKPALSIFYLGFQNESKLFGNKLVRQAFNYAVDREKIVTYTLQGEGIPAIHGIVPPSFKGYDYKDVKGYTFDPDKAKKLLAQAGYPNGKGFPKITLQTNSGGGDRNIQIAEVVQKMLKENLNVNVEINVLPFPEHLETIETGKALFWRAGWIADYPDPEDFLTLLYSKHIPPKLSDRSYINSVRYKNPKFDSLFEKALQTVDKVQRYKYYEEADQVEINDAPILPIFYDENYRLIHDYVKNFPENAMEFRDMSRVYLLPKRLRKK